MPRALRVAAAAAALALATPAPAGVAEEWYLARGRANLRIANYGAAIEAYEHALRANPRSREASRGIALALAQNGDTDRAVAELDRHLALFPDDAELAFEQARLLQWSRYAYRRRDAVRYLRMGLAARDDPARRRELARLLARERATAGEALAEYDRLLAADPHDVALRDERLRLLLWDPAHREEALRELEARVRARPDDDEARRDLARLAAADPARAPAAVAHYDALLARHPADPELHLGRARALARAGRRADAREAYGRAIALRPTLGARLERAELLAAHPDTRDAARVEFEGLSRDAPRSRRARLGLARVLLSRKETSPAAAVELRAVLHDAPRDAEAHRGLARAYAWSGDGDRALAHDALARRYAPAAAPDPADAALRRGREPTLGAGTRVLAQPGGGFAASSLAGFAAASADPTPFTSSAVEGGAVVHRAAGARAEGAFVAARGAWRPGPGDRLGASLAWDGARLAGRRLGGELAFRRERDGRALRLALLRTPRQDSFRALAGEEVDGAPVGAAFDEVAEAALSLARGGSRLDLAARAGAVTGAGFAATFTAGASARADREVLRRGGWGVRVGASAAGTHHARDRSGRSGADPRAPRLFSPPLFVAASPRLTVSREGGPALRMELDAGPSLQHTTGPGGGTRLGGDFRVSVTRRFGERLRLGMEEHGEVVSRVYRRFVFAGTLALLF